MVMKCQLSVQKKFLLTGTVQVNIIYKVNFLSFKYYSQ